MNVVNFLPRDYSERRTRRRANMICLLLSGLTVLALGMVTAVYLFRTAQVAGFREVVEQQYREASRKIEQLKVLEKQREDLLHKVELSAGLLERVPRSIVLAHLTNALPKETSLHAVTMKTEKVEIDDPNAPKVSTRAQGLRGRRSRQSTPKITVTRTLFELAGLAPTDVEVAAYIAALTADPLFGEVNMEVSEEFPLDEGVQVRRFKLVFRLSEEAEKVIEESGTPGETEAPGIPVAMAGGAE
jgi:Tfp pilus assembly protein PilN